MMKKVELHLFQNNRNKQNKLNKLINQLEKR